MIVKVLEVRDRMTFIPVMAIKMNSEDDIQKYYLRRAGYGEDSFSVSVICMDNFKGYDDPYKWDCMSRTMHEAHKYISKNWDLLNDGDVVDVEYVLGETDTPKVSERFNGWSD